MGGLNMHSFGLNGSGGRPRDTGLVLTAEEIEWIAASTSLWLVVRETDGSFEGERLIRVPQLFSFSGLILAGGWSVT
jgi:hypothetical protein